MNNESQFEDGDLQLPPFGNGVFNGETAPATKPAETERVIFRAGRNRRGRFTKGNKGGPGNPSMRRVAMLRKAAQAAVSEEMVRDIMAALAVRALTGDLSAAKLVLAYAIGKPEAAGDLDGDEAEELDTLGCGDE